LAYPIPPLKNDLLLRAVNREAVPRVPVWLMRQAGRSDPEYRAYRERVGLDLYDLFRSPEHAVPISLLPRRIGVDAIIMFQDILTPLTPMGADFKFNPGPLLERPIASADRIEALQPYEVEAELGFVALTIRGLLEELGGALPVLGFAGAPFTLAAFMIEGKSPALELGPVLAFIREEPAAFAALLERLTAVTIAYLSYQVAAGVHAVQLFESMGERIPRPIYEQYVQPSHERIFAALSPKAPTILFVRGSPFPDLMLRSGAAVLSVGANTPLAAIQGHGGVVQGNVDNQLLATGTPDEVEAAARACLTAGGGRGHILNLGHGILAETPFENVRRFVETTHAFAFPPQN
jgi:uroporphyrinogen decarboxylase